MGNRGTEYIIVGDGLYKGSLIYACGGKENAEKVLNRMLTNPDDHDLRSMEGLNNFRIEEVVSKDCWWNDPFLAN